MVSQRLLRIPNLHILKLHTYKEKELQIEKTQKRPHKDLALLSIMYQLGYRISLTVGQN